MIDILPYYLSKRNWPLVRSDHKGSATAITNTLMKLCGMRWLISKQNAEELVSMTSNLKIQEQQLYSCILSPAYKYWLWNLVKLLLLVVTSV